MSWIPGRHSNAGRLLRYNGLLLASSFLVAMIVTLVLAFGLSYRVLAPQMIQTLASGFRHLPAETDYEALWSARAEDIRALPALVETVALYRDGELSRHMHRPEQHVLPTRITELNPTPGPPRISRQFQLDEAGQWTLYVVANASLMTSLYRQTLLGLVLFFMIAAVVTFWLSNRYQRTISRPIHNLIEVARDIDRTENFSRRASEPTNNEVGTLVSSFNAMLDRIQSRDDQLRAARNRAQDAQREAQAKARESRDANHRLEVEVSVRARAEQRLTELQSYLTAMINSMPAALIAVDENIRITQWNDGATHLSGTPLASAMGHPLELAFPFLADFQPALRKALVERKIQRLPQVTFSYPGQPDLKLDIVVYPLRLTGTIGAVVRIDDVTERTRLEELMVQSEKMMSVGGLAAGMAHEINNPLSAMVQSAQTVRRRLSPDVQTNRTTAEKVGLDMDALQRYLSERDIDRFLDHVLSAGERAGHIVTNMLQFSRQSDSARQPRAVGDILTRSLSIAMSDLDLRQNVKDGALIVEERWAECAQMTIPVIGTEIEQVLFNLIKNAWQAIRGADDAPGRIVISCKATDDNCIIQVSDNGPGMSLSTRKRVFEPFFTTKDVGQGTGLGLSVAYFIVTTHHRGELTVQSSADRGTTFTIRLPRSVGASSTDTV